MENDRRNVIDAFRGISTEDIKDILDKTRNNLEIAIENLERDFNMGTIVRTANAFNVRTVHVIGRRQWNKRGAMATDKYLDVCYHDNVQQFLQSVSKKNIIGIDIIEESLSLHDVKLPLDSILVFGSEKNGLSSEMIKSCSQIIAIEQFGSTRSMNVGVAAGIAMYAWMQQHVLTS